jgi:hypothetical protein
MGQPTYTGVLRQVIASLTEDRRRTLRAMTRVHADLLNRSHDVAVQLGTSEGVPVDEVLDVEQTATLAAAASLLCAAHASSDRLLLAEAEMRTEDIGSMLDEIAEAHRAGDPDRVWRLRRDVGVAVGAYADAIRSAA